jgi:ribosomal protein S27AE
VGKRDATNPYVGLPGFWNRWNRLTYFFSGAAQVGVGRGVTEAPEQRQANPLCPMCGKPMAEHRIDRGTATVPTRVHCPV